MIVAIHKPNYLHIRNSYIWRLEKHGLEATTEELLAELGEDFIKELCEISFEEALSAYEKMREKEWKRLYTNVEDGLIVVKQMVTINEKLKIQIFLYNPFLNFNLEEWSKKTMYVRTAVELREDIYQALKRGGRKRKRDVRKDK